MNPSTVDKELKVPSLVHRETRTRKRYVHMMDDAVIFYYFAYGIQSIKELYNTENKKKEKMSLASKR